MKQIKDKFDLTNRPSVITGAAGLLGKQHSIALAQKGSIVIMTDIDLESLQVAKEEVCKITDHEKVYAYCMDVTQEQSIQELRSELISEGIQPSILVNNAAIDPTMKDPSQNQHNHLERFPLDEWNRQINVGLTGAFLCSRIFGNDMAEKKHGVILNIASDLSVFAPDQRIYKKANLKKEEQPLKPVTYSVIKTGLIGLTRYLATYWADRNVRANALSPGGIYNGQDEEFTKKLSNLIPLGRMAYEDDYIGAIQFLCSDASSYMNGQNIVIDGGRSAW